LSPLLGRATVDLGESDPGEDLDNADGCDECDDADVDHNMEHGIDRGIDSADESDEEDRGEPAEMDYYASEAEDVDD
jgi:hypothetical protein